MSAGRQYTFDSLVPRPLDLPTAVPLDEGADLSVLDDAKILIAPEDPAERPAWRAALARWRSEARTRLGHDDGIYRIPGAQWAQRAYAVAQVWLWDELLFDAEAHRFTPDRFLADATERLGGLDAVVLWHAYPVIGLDDRNQWDYYRQVPGLRGLVDDFHRAGLAVCVDYNPWDTGTRRGAPDAEELAALVADLGADGVFLDTLKEGDPDLVAALREANPAVVLEGESKLPLARVADHASSWAQFFADSPVPGVMKTHWFERAHMQHHVRRWHRDHCEELSSAWLNGVGMMVWEVVFGVWVGWTPRDASVLRRALAVQRSAHEVLQRGEWEPLTALSDQAERARVYASRFTLGDVLLCVANRGEADYEGPLFAAPASGRVLDLMSGADLDPLATVTVPAQGIAAVALVRGKTPQWAASAIAATAGLAHEGDASFPHRLARRLHADERSAGSGPSDGVVSVPAGTHVLTVRYRARETGMYQGAPYVDEWKPLVPRLHDPRTLQRVLEADHPVAVADREVSVGEFLDFVARTGYRPHVPHRFLQGVDAAQRDRPVTFVDLEDARAFCAWVGGRLPTEDEWQVAAGRPGFRRRRPAVWNWTNSEHSDGRTRFAMLKGGADHVSDGSEWYFDGGVRSPEFSAKLLLPGLGLARSASIGFRVAWDGRTEGDSPHDREP